MKRKTILAGALMASLAVSAQTAEPRAKWLDPNVNRVGTEAPRASFFAYESQELARQADKSKSNRYLSLEGMWRFHWVKDHDKEAYNILRDYNPVYRDEIKDLPAVGSGGGSGANNGYAEEIITVAPDVILAGFSAEAADELYGQTGIPVVCVRYLSRNFVDESFYDAMRVFAEVVGAQERCESVLSFIDECKQDLNDRTKDIPDSDKQKVYTGAVTFSGRHGFGGTYAHFGPFMGVNALNVADEAADQNYYEVDLEKVIEWDPDIIFLDPGNMDLVNDEYNTNPGFFDALRAVKEGQVYTMPSFNNCGTNITYALMDAYYAGIVLYPEQFADVTMPEIGGKILSFMLGKDTFAEMEAGGLYYGELTIGE